MTSTWDEFARKIHTNTMRIEELTALVGFIKEFDAVNNDIIVIGFYQEAMAWRFDFTGWTEFIKKAVEGKMSAKEIAVLIEYLHDFDHGNEQVLAHTFDKDNHHYWSKHTTHRNFMGTFSRGKWKYSKKFLEQYREAKGCR